MMDASECKDCKRFVGYEYSDHGNPYVLCYWRTDPKKPWSRNEQLIAVEVKKDKPVMSRKELRKWLKSPHGKLRYERQCSCYEREEDDPAEGAGLGIQANRRKVRAVSVCCVRPD